MVKVNIKALLVEDSPSDADLIVEGLERSDVGSFDLSHVQTLAEAEKQLKAKNDFSAVLLDLGLPDSQGVDTLKKVLEFSGDIPVIVLTGLDDYELGREAVRLGADDYLVKGTSGFEKNNFITRSISFSIERHKVRLEAMANKARSHHDKQVSTLSGIAIDDSDEPLGLSKREKGRFQAFQQRYENILKRLVRETEEATGYDMRADLEAMANELGALNAGPHDVVEIHSSTLKSMAENMDAHGVSLLVDEGNVTSLGLMGLLVSYYRNKF